MAIRVKQGGTVVGQWDAGATVGSESLPDGCSRSRWRSEAGCRRAALAQYSVFNALRRTAAEQIFFFVIHCK